MKLLIRIGCILFIAIGFVLQVSAQEAEDREVEKAIEEVEQKDYAALISEGYLSADLFYNHGLKKLEEGQLASAILSFERALRLSPNDAEIKKAIRLARRDISEAVIPAEQFFLSRAIKKWASFISAGWWGVFAILFLWLLLSCVYGWMIGKKWTSWFPGRGMVIGSVVIFLITLFLAVTRYQMRQADDAAIVMQDEATLRPGPDELGDAIQSLGAGEKVYILNSIGDWYQVELLNRDRGWLKMEVVEKLIMGNEQLTMNR